MPFTRSLLEHGTSPPTRGDVRLIFDEREDAERAADWLEDISAGRFSLGASHKGRKGGWIVRGVLKLPEATAEEVEG